MKKEPSTTADALFGGRLKLFQPADGYRVNVDAVLLGAFAGAGRQARKALDLGAGVGAVGLTLLHLGGAAHVTFVEREATLADLCAQNLRANRMSTRGTVRVADLDGATENIAEGSLHAHDLVVANPPYVPPERDARRAAASNGRLAARHGRLDPFVRTAAATLGRRGRVCFVYPAHALLELLVLARSARLEPKKLRFVHGKTGRPARVALVELVFGKPGGLVVAPPLVETGDDGRPSRELATLLDTPRASG